MCVCVFVSADEIPQTTMCIKYEFLGDSTALFLYSVLVKITKNNKKGYIKTHSHFCMNLESNSHATHRTLPTVNCVLNNCYRNKEKAQSTFSATFFVPYS